MLLTSKAYSAAGCLVKCVEKFFAREGEPVEDAKKRLSGDKENLFRMPVSYE